MPRRLEYILRDLLWEGPGFQDREARHAPPEGTYPRARAHLGAPLTHAQAREPIAQGMLSLAKANYEIGYSSEQHVSERIIFPSSPTESNGIEDARFVRFVEDDGSVRYYATYTAFDGKVI